MANKTAKKGGGAPPLASAPEGPRRTPPNGGDPRNAPEEKFISESPGNKWNTVTLGSIAESVDYGVTASSKNKPVGPKFLRITDIQDGGVNWDTVPWCECDSREAESSKLIPGDIVFARTGATTGKSFLIRDCPPECVFASYLIRVRFGKPVDSGYINQFFQSNDYWTQINQNARGAAQPGVNATILKTLEIPLPPLPEQRRIAVVLDRVEGLRAKRRESIARIELLSQSVFREIFGDPVRNPMKWELAPFGDVCETRLGKMLDQKQQTGRNPRAYLRNANVQWFRFDLDEVFEMDFDQKARETHLLRDGDLLICEGGDPGRCAIWHGEIVECYFQKALHRARPNKALCNSEYLSWLLWFLSKGGGLSDYVTSATIAHLTGEKLKGIPIPIPPITLQQEFARRLTAVEKLKATHHAALAQLDALFASLQHRAFRGEL